MTQKSRVFNASNNPVILDLVTRYQKRSGEELYNTKIDPFELDNLAEKESVKIVKEKLSIELDKWMKQQGTLVLKSILGMSMKILIKVTISF